MASGAGLDPGGEDDRSPARSAGVDVEAMLAAAPDPVSGPVVDLAPVVITIDTGPAGRWTLRVQGDGRVLRAAGAARRSRVTIRTDADTLVAMLSGRESGVGAFMDGRLTVRGSLGLALLLEGALAPATRPAAPTRSTPPAAR